MAKKQRLIFLGTLLIGLILFYFGIDTWLKQKNLQQNQPPPVVLKPIAPVKPQLKDEENGVNSEETTSKSEPLEIKKEIKKPKKESMETEKKTQQKLRTYKFQIGAFKYEENAYKLYRKAKKFGYYAKVVKGRRFYRVYVYVKAENLRIAKRKVVKHFKEAIFVRR